jgi:hypothetical protein
MNLVLNINVFKLRCEAGVLRLKFSDLKFTTVNGLESAKLEIL